MEQPATNFEAFDGKSSSNTEGNIPIYPDSSGSMGGNPKLEPPKLGIVVPKTGIFSSNVIFLGSGERWGDSYQLNQTLRL